MDDPKNKYNWLEAAAARPDFEKGERLRTWVKNFVFGYLLGAAVFFLFVGTLILFF